MEPQHDYDEGYEGVYRPLTERTLPYIWGEEAREKKERERRASIPEPDGSSTIALLALPLVFWPGLLIWNSWNYLSAESPDMNFWVKVLLCLAEFGALLWLLDRLFRMLPRSAAGLAMAAYFAFSYWWAATHWINADENWTIGITLVTALIGFWFGRTMTSA